MARHVQVDKTFRPLSWTEQLIVSFDLAAFLAYVKNHKGNLGDNLAHLNLSLGSLRLLMARGYLKLVRHRKSPIHTGRVTPEGESFIISIRKEAERVWPLLQISKLQIPDLGLTNIDSEEEKRLLKDLKSTISFFVLHDKNLVEAVYGLKNKKGSGQSKRKSLTREEWLMKHGTKRAVIR